MIPTSPAAIVFDCDGTLADTTLTHTGLAGLAHTAVAGDGVTAPKPAPDLYYTACRQLGTPPNRTVAIEDSPIGITAARAAGLIVIGVGAAAHSAHAHHDRLDNPALRQWLTGIRSPITDVHQPQQSIT